MNIKTNRRPASLRLAAALLSAAMLFTTAGGCSLGGKTDSASDIVYSVSEDIDAPTFSAESGLYGSPFSLELSCGKGCDIRYTLDGSEPDGSSALYEAPISIADRTGERNDISDTKASLFVFDSKFKPKNTDKGTVIRAAAFDKHGKRSETVTASYFVGLDYSGLKMVSLVMDRDDLFDYNRGIYVLGKAFDDWQKEGNYPRNFGSWELPGNYSQKGREWERPVHADFLAGDGSLLLSQELGARMMGTASRTYYQKSFRLYARDEYDKKNMNAELIDGLTRECDDEPMTKFKSIVLRNGGNDCEYTKVRDPFIQKLVEERDFSTQGSEPCAVFINGEFWGLYAITEDYSDDYLEDNYDVNKDNVVIIKVGELDEGKDSDVVLYEQFLSFIESADFTDQKDYDHICEILDIDNYIDYCALMIYIDNMDGIFGDYGDNNWRIWRTRDPENGNEYGDCRWRFMVYDTEYSLGLYGDAQYNDNNLESILNDEQNGIRKLFPKLMENEDFRERFVTVFMDMRSGCFASRRCENIVNEMAGEYHHIFDKQLDRNGPEWAMFSGSSDSYFYENLGMIKQYMKGRYSYAPNMIRDTLGLGDYHDLRLNVTNYEGGTVTVNTITPELNDGTWSGRYFAEYPVTVTATPAEGWHFAGWGDDASDCDIVSGSDVADDSSQIVITLSDDLMLEPRFEKN